jgi:hypothetical protein
LRGFIVAHAYHTENFLEGFRFPSQITTPSPFEFSQQLRVMHLGTRTRQTRLVVGNVESLSAVLKTRQANELRQVSVTRGPNIFVNQATIFRLNIKKSWTLADLAHEIAIADSYSEKSKRNKLIARV